MCYGGMLCIRAVYCVAKVGILYGRAVQCVVEWFNVPVYFVLCRYTVCCEVG